MGTAKVSAGVGVARLDVLYVEGVWMRGGVMRCCMICKKKGLTLTSARWSPQTNDARELVVWESVPLRSAYVVTNHRVAAT